MDIWHLWIIGGFFMLVIEVLTMGFFTASAALGCFCAAMVSACGGNATWQLLAFSVGVLVCFFGIRPFALKYIGKKQEIRTNVDALVGQTGRVLITIDNRQAQGRVSMGGDDWRAVANNDNTIIVEGANVVVLRVDSNILVVEPLTTKGQTTK